MTSAGRGRPTGHPTAQRSRTRQGGTRQRTGTSATSSCSTWRRGRPRRSRNRSRRPRRAAAARSVPPTPSSRRTARPSSTGSIAPSTIGRRVRQGALACGSCPSRAGRASCSSTGRSRAEHSRPMGQHSPWGAATGSMVGSASPTPTGRTCACWSAVLPLLVRSGRLTARGSRTSTLEERHPRHMDKVFVVDVSPPARPPSWPRGWPEWLDDHTLIIENVVTG